MTYWILYLAVAVPAWAFGAPWLALPALMLVVARNTLPDPLTYYRELRTLRELRERVAAYPGDLLARRTLAELYLAHGKARPAVALLEEAIAKGLDDAEAFRLLGTARMRAHDPEGALGPIVKSVEKDERVGMGDAYFTAAEALRALGRIPEAEDALERGLKVNSSRVDALVRLAQVRTQRGDRDGAAKAYATAVDTWRQLPGYLQWEMLGSYARARWGAGRRGNHPKG